MVYVGLSRVDNATMGWWWWGTRLGESGRKVAEYAVIVI